MWRRLWRRDVTHERHTRALRVPVGDIGRQGLRTCRSTVLGPRHQCSGERRHQRRADVVQSQREVTVGAQSQVSSTVSTVSRCTRQLWTATCPQRHHRPTRFDITSHSNTAFSRHTCINIEMWWPYIQSLYSNVHEPIPATLMPEHALKLVSTPCEVQLVNLTSSTHSESRPAENLFLAVRRTHTLPCSKVKTYSL